MQNFRLPFLLAFSLALFSCSQADPKKENNSEKAKASFHLSAEEPEKSHGITTIRGKARFPVGFGRNGLTEEGKAFKGGSTLLGEFRVTAVLSKSRFEMEPELVKSSGKSKAWLRQNLFSNMNSIDFDGDGKGGEYGSLFIGLHPIDSKAKQPFHFGNYKGTFRWYSFAIHGTQDESRIGKCVTGGCINVGEEHLKFLAQRLKVNDLVSIQELVTKK